MLRIQMSTASGGSGWCHVWLCMSEQGLLGWLIRAEGCRGGLNGRCLESRGAFRISAVSKTLLMCSVAYTDVLFLCDTLSLPCIKPFSPASLLRRIACLRLKILLVLGGSWKIYNRWAVFEGYVFSNYLFAEGFGWAAAEPNVLPTQPRCLRTCYLLPISRIEFR